MDALLLKFVRFLIYWLLVHMSSSYYVVTCTNCGKAAKLPKELSPERQGKTIRCPHCRTPLPVRDKAQKKDTSETLNHQQHLLIHSKKWRRIQQAETAVLSEQSVNCGRLLKKCFLSLFYVSLGGLVIIGGFLLHHRRH